MDNQPFWRLREFWILVIDMVISTALYFGGKYARPELFDDIKWAIAALQPVAAFFVAYFTVERTQQLADARQAKLEAKIARSR